MLPWRTESWRLHYLRTQWRIANGQLSIFQAWRLHTRYCIFQAIYVSHVQGGGIRHGNIQLAIKIIRTIWPVNSRTVVTLLHCMSLLSNVSSWHTDLGKIPVLYTGFRWDVSYWLLLYLLLSGNMASEGEICFLCYQLFTSKFKFLKWTFNMLVTYIVCM